MDNLNEQLKQPSLFSDACDVSKGKFLPFVDPIEARAVRTDCKAVPNNIVSCKNPQNETFLKEVDGLDFATVKIRQPDIVLPRLIPIIDRGMFKQPGDMIESRFVGLSLEDLFSSPPLPKDGRLKQAPLSIRRDVLRSPVFKNKAVLLFASGRDVHIETVWQKFLSLDLDAAVSGMGFAAVTGINFSVFFGECGFAQALNLKKSLKSSELFQEAGSVAIPHVYFAHELHLRRWIVWLQANPTVNTIAVNCQFRKADDAAFLAAGIMYLLENVGRKITVILEGPDPGKMKKLFRKYPDSITVAMKGLSLSAQFHQQYELSGDKMFRWSPGKVPIPEIFNRNTQSYSQYLETLSSRIP